MRHGQRMMGSPVPTVNAIAPGDQGECAKDERLARRPDLKIAIHVDTAERAFDRIDLAILITI